MKLGAKGTNFVPNFNFTVGVQDSLKIPDHSHRKCTNEGANESSDGGTHTTTDLQANVSTYRRTAQD